ncbi:hypothetical protein [Sphingomonas sp. RS2018]
MSTIGALFAAGCFRTAPKNTVRAEASATAFGVAAVLTGLHQPDAAQPESSLGVGTMKTEAGARSSTTDLADSIAKLNGARDAFRKETSLTPAQRARRDVLDAMDLTEEAIKAMPPEQQGDIEQTIATEVARRLRERSH